MRLIKARVLFETQSISFEEFYGELPQYAILSHTWKDNQEVTFQECNTKAAQLKSGYEKITKTCQLALKDGLEYVWVDTCCIDKSSSAELTEAINSMFLWYQKAKICYVYPVDKFENDRLSSCRWFTRGWTLQELIAPATIFFYDYWWDCIGTKESLISDLCLISNIDENILLHRFPVSSACIAKRLSWAARRKTTRVEDMAYCLLGICNIHMPMLYGEGKAAFRRLQEEIIRTTYDLSLLAWTPPDSNGEYCGFLAESVNYFVSCHTMYSLTDPLLDEGEIGISNKGLRLKARVYVLDYLGLHRRYYLKLDCHTPEKGGEFLAIPMRKVGPNTFVRARGRSISASSSEVSNSTAFCLEPVSAGRDTFYNVTLLPGLPQLSANTPLWQGNSNIVSFGRLTTVKFELPQSIAIVPGSETPNRFWDMEDNAFFSSRGSYLNWGAFVLNTKSMFLCFWQFQELGWELKGTILDMESEGIYALWKDLRLSANQLSSEKPIVDYIRNNMQDLMETKVELERDDRKIELSFQIWRKDDLNFCSGPRWRVVFRETVLS